jgi:hypothetical protein
MFCGNNCGNFHTNRLEIRIKPIDLAEAVSENPNVLSWDLLRLVRYRWSMKIIDFLQFFGNI